MFRYGYGMFFQHRSNFYVLILFVLFLGCSAPDAHAMKRVPESTVSSADTTVVTGAHIFPIQNLVEDVLRRILAMSNKTAIVQVCKQWFTFANFKQNWPSFCDTYATVLSLSTRDYQRIYYLMLKANDVEGMEKLIVTDNEVKKNFEAVFKILYQHPGQLAQSQQMKDLLEKHGVALIRNQYQGIPRTYVEIREQKRALPESEWPVAEYENRELSKEGAGLADVILSNDKQALMDLIAASGGVLREELSKSYVLSDVVGRYGTISAIEEVFKWGGMKICDLIVAPAIKAQRIAIADFLLSKGADIDFISAENEILSEALRSSNYAVLELLCKRGCGLNDRREIYIELDGNGNQVMEHGEQIDVTPLMYAVYQQDPLLVKPLLKYGGANPFEVNNRSPWLGDVLDLAKRLGNQEIIDAIELARIVEKNMKARLLPQKQSDESKHDENEPNENGSDEHELNEDSMMLDEHEYEI